METHVYLAGPDVFRPDAVEIGAAKKKLVAEAGMIGHFPFDNEIAPELFSDPPAAAVEIGQKNEEMMDRCCGEGKIGVILANMTPYHGVSTDAGTAFELGYMSALAKRENVIIIGYSDDRRSFFDRVKDDQYHGKVTQREDGRFYGEDGNALENFGQADNLMLTHAIEKTGGEVCHSFEEAVQRAKELSEAKQAMLSTPQTHAERVTSERSSDSVGLSL